MTDLWFVRHTVTAETGKKLSGWTKGVKLNEEGIAQARVTAEAMKSLPLRAVYSSPLDRTVETARVIARPHNLTVRISRDLGEVRYGSWTNRSLKVLARTKLWSKVQSWPSGVRFPDGETLREVQTRAVAEVERIAAEHAKQAVCIVSHGDVIRLVMAHYLGVHIDLFQRIVISPGSISGIGLSDRGPWVLGVNLQQSMWHKEKDPQEGESG